VIASATTSILGLSGVHPIRVNACRRYGRAARRRDTPCVS